MIKKLLFTALTTLGLATTLLAQGPTNAGFELWVPLGSMENPIGWATGNYIVSPPILPNSPSCFKTTDKHSGSYAMKLQSVKLAVNPVPGKLKDTIGAAFTGAINFTSLIYGYGDTVRPSEMHFWSKYTPVGNDTAIAGIILQKRNGKNVDTVAIGGTKIFGTYGTYTEFVAPITYYLPDVPDTITVLFSACGEHKPQIGSELLVDDISYVIPVGIKEVTIGNIPVVLYPNPAINQVTISTSSSLVNYVEVFDIAGKKIGKYDLVNGEVLINTSAYPHGLYTYSLLNNNNETLSRGKFNVNRY